MATTMYFEGSIPQTNKAAEADPRNKVDTEIIVSSFSGNHELYLDLVDINGHRMHMIFDKKTARDFHDSLERAMDYLGY